MILSLAAGAGPEASSSVRISNAAGTLPDTRSRVASPTSGVDSGVDSGVAANVVLLSNRTMQARAVAPRWPRVIISAGRCPQLHTNVQLQVGRNVAPGHLKACGVQVGLASADRTQLPDAVE